MEANLLAKNFIFLHFVYRPKLYKCYNSFNLTQR